MAELVVSQLVKFLITNVTNNYVLMIGLSRLYYVVVFVIILLVVIYTSNRFLIRMDSPTAN